MLEHLKTGGCMAVTPDGPRGPRMRAGIGAVRLAQLSGAPMILFAWSTSKRVVFKSWDRFVLPLPFGEGVIVWGGLIHAPRNSSDAELAALREKLEHDLIAITQEADRLAGVPVIEPADPNERRRRRSSETAPEEAGAVG
jgi:lysophospholipid acyltransferase (LPLAT)-like uncharacterized protein